MGDFRGRAKEVFAAAIQEPPANRGALVERECGHDEALLGDVNELLRHHDETGDFLRPPLVSVSSGSSRLERSVVGAAATRAADRSPTTPQRLPDAGSIVADRYRLEARLGEGAFGAVFRATDQLTSRAVAVKLMRRPTEGGLRIWRREVAMLRRACFPGVVALLDEGIDAEYAFIVMSLLEGTPFPGEGAAGRWDAIEQGCLGVLEALDRLHWAGLVHRDLKPENVLVDPDGRPTIVDLGVALEGDGGPRPGARRELAGTPLYLAPELFLGRPPSAGSDLYSLGVMLFEILAGRPPHPAGSIAELVQARTKEPAPALGSVAPAVPARVAHTVDRLLERDPEARPASAEVVIALLRGDEVPRRAIHDLPPLDDGDAVAGLTAAASSRRSAHLFGPTGSGRSRALAEAANELEEAGFEVRRTTPDNRPLGSLEPALGAAPEGLEPVEVVSWAGERLSSLLRSGVIVVADDLDQVDPVSRDVLVAERSGGVVLSSSRSADFPEAVRLQPVSVERMRGLFEGPERLLHIPEDAAHALWIRTAGLPGRIVDELDAWVRGGIARSENGRILIDRAAVERLIVDPTIHAPPPALLRTDPDPTRTAALARIERCGAGAELDVIAAALDLSPEVATRELESLEESGALTRVGEAWVLNERSRHDPTGSTPTRRSEVHSRIAGRLLSGDSRRLHHLIAAGRLEEVAVEAAACARSMLDAGQSGEAMAALTLGLAMARTDAEGAPEATDELLTLLIQAALTVYSRQSIDMLLYQVGRARHRTAVVETVERLARGAAQGQHGNAERALRLLEDPVPSDQPELERWRHTIRVVTAQAAGDDPLSVALSDLHKWAKQSRDPDARSLLARWLGWRRYRRLRFHGAAHMHEWAAQRARTPLGRLTSMADAAIASLDGFEFDRAFDQAGRCRELAAAARATHSEARAEWILRCAAYRRGDDLEVDRELLDAAGALGVPALEALIHQNEAAVAWRTGRRSAARQLAARGSDLAAGAGREPVAMLLRALAFAVGEPLRPAEDEELLARVDRCPIPGLAAQAAALLRTGGHAAGEHLAEIVERNAGRLPEALHGARREILSIAEAQTLADPGRTGSGAGPACMTLKGDEYE